LSSLKEHLPVSTNSLGKRFNELVAQKCHLLPMSTNSKCVCFVGYIDSSGILWFFLVGASERRRNANIFRLVSLEPSF
jgi:hypothetical protein